MRILIVDDMPEILESYERVLIRNGYDVRKANDGQEALEMMQGEAHHIDAIVTDHNMPRMTGEQLCRALRAAGSEVPILLITGDLSVVNQARSFGATESLWKGLNNNREILEFVEQHGYGTW